MAKKSRVLLFAVCGLVGIVLLAVIGLLFFVDINSYKPRVEAVASTAFGMAVTIEGPMRLSFAPGLRVALENVRIQNRGSELAFLKEADLAIQLLPLMQQQVRTSRIEIKGARIYIERNRDGVFNYQKSPGQPARPLDLPKVSFADLNLIYADKQAGNRAEFEDRKSTRLNSSHQ